MKGYDRHNVNHAIQGAEVGVTGGPTATTSAKTPGNGQWRYQPLDPGGYTVATHFPSDLDEIYDVTGVANQGAVLAAGDHPTVVFLVPETWVEFIVKDTVPQTLQNIEWRLERQPVNGGSFKKYDTGTTAADGKVEKTRCKTGAHKFFVKELTNPVWSATEAVIGEETS